MDITKFTLLDQFLDVGQHGLNGINLDYRFILYNSELGDDRVRVNDFIPIIMQLKLYKYKDPNNPPRTDISYEEMAKYILSERFRSHRTLFDRFRSQQSIFILSNKSIPNELADLIIKKIKNEKAVDLHLSALAANSSYPVRRFLHKYVDEQFQSISDKLFGFTQTDSDLARYGHILEMGLSANPNIDDEIVKKYYYRPFDFMILISRANISPIMVDKIINEKLTTESIERIAYHYIQNDHMDVDYYISKFGHLNRPEVKIRDHIKKINDIYKLSKNINDRFVKHFTRWFTQENSLFAFQLLNNETNISKDLILEIIGYKYINLYLKVIVAANFSPDMIDNNPDIEWNYHILSGSRGITKAYVMESIGKGLNPKKWNWPRLLANKYADITPEFVEEFAPENIKLKLKNQQNNSIKIRPYNAAIHLTPKFVIDHINEMDFAIMFDMPNSIIFNNFTFT